MPRPRKPLTPAERRAGLILLMIALLPVIAIFMATETVSEIALQRFMASLGAIGFLAIAIYSLRSGVVGGQGESRGMRVTLLLPGLACIAMSILFAVRWFWLR